MASRIRDVVTLRRIRNDRLSSKQLIRAMFWSGSESSLYLLSLSMLQETYSALEKGNLRLPEKTSVSTYAAILVPDFKVRVRMWTLPARTLQRLARCRSPDPEDEFWQT
jgi:hypothetical protein